MKFLDRLQRKFGKFAIPNLMLYIVFANAAVFILELLDPTPLSYLLMLIPDRVFAGEVWRVITFIMIPPTDSVIFIIFVLYFYYLIGNTLEQTWGSFKFNVFYFTGVVMLIATSLIFGITASSTYLNMTLFFAFARLHPEFQVRIYFILPVKIKYLAYFSAGLLVFQFIIGGVSTKISVLAGVTNFFLFFGKEIVMNRKTRIKSQVRKQQYDKGVRRQNEHAHQCTVCGITEIQDPTMEFRYCSKCDGYHEYCMEHLNDHDHIKETTY